MSSPCGESSIFFSRLSARNLSNLPNLPKSFYYLSVRFVSICEISARRALIFSWSPTVVGEIFQIFQNQSKSFFLLYLFNFLRPVGSKRAKLERFRFVGFLPREGHSISLSSNGYENRRVISRCLGGYFSKGECFIRQNKSECVPVLRNRSVNSVSF